MSTITSPASAELKKQLIIKTAGRRSDFTASTAVAATAAAPTLRNDLSPKLKIERRSVDSIKAARRRVKKLPARQVERILKVIQRVGICAPILIDRDGHVVDGHGVLAAAKALSIESIPCVIVDHLSEPEIEFLKVALNRVAECGEWDLDGLKPVLIELRDEGFVLEDTGFSVPEIDIIIIEEAPVQSEVGEEALVPNDDPVSLTGDLWLLDDHRLYCGDATDPTSYEAALKGSKAQAIFTDPPWNIPIKGFVSKQHDDFRMGAGEMSDAEFADFIDRFTRLSVEHLAAGAVMFSCIDWRSFDLIVGRAKAAGLRLINTAVWHKGSGGMGSLYRSAYELVPVLCNGDTPRVNNVELGKNGRDRTNVWSYPGANRKGSSASEALKHHPTPKPIEMVHDAIIDVTNLGETVLDPFLGSGTTLIAAERAGRICYGIELDPAYVDLSVTRWQATTGRDAIHEQSGLTFAELQRVRADDDRSENLVLGESSQS